MTLNIFNWSFAVHGINNTAWIRIQEISGWISLVLLFFTLLIGPTYKIFPNLGAKRLFFEARRMLGIGSGWFAFLHASVAYIAQLQIVNPFELDGTYQKSFFIGTVSLVILLIMTFTSFDKAMKRLGKWWFSIHRLIYLAGLLAVLHAFMVGVHTVNIGVIALVGLLLGALLTLHVTVMIKQGKMTDWQFISIIAYIVFAVSILSFAVSRSSNDQTHSSHTEARS